MALKKVDKLAGWTVVMWVYQKAVKLVELMVVSMVD
jgi:hypothetical protein